MQEHVSSVIGSNNEYQIVYDRCALLFAIFRRHTSTRESWGRFKDEFETIKDHGYQWNYNVPIRTLHHCLDIVERCIAPKIPVLIQSDVGCYAF